EGRVTHLAVEALDVAVLHGLAWREVVLVDPVIPRPGKDCDRGELRAVVGDGHPRLAASSDQGRQRAGHALPGDRGIRDRGQTLPGGVVDDAGHAGALAAGKTAFRSGTRLARHA